MVEKYLHIEGSNEDKFRQLSALIPNEFTHTAVEELRFILNFFGKKTAGDFQNNSGNRNDTDHVMLDFSLARGLNYYTGIIIEVRATGVRIGSIGGGGRYDDLTGLFGVPGIPGVGISFGVDRIYDVMEELGLFPKTVQRSAQILFFNLGENAALKSFELMQLLRESGIRCELYHEQAKFDKQFKYAEKKNIPDRYHR